MQKELYQIERSEVSLNISEGAVTEVRRKHIVRSGCRVYDGGKLGISGVFGEPDEATWQAAQRALTAGLSHPEPLGALVRSRETGVMPEERELLEQGLSPKAAASRAEKTAIEDARFVLPNACDTKMIVTMNARSLMNFFELRCCQRAQWEIREVADQMLRLCLGVAPHLFQKAGPGCVRGGCPEGKMTCGMAAEMREKYAKMREEAHG